jgi:hypothetical protein
LMFVIHLQVSCVCLHQLLPFSSVPVVGNYVGTISWIYVYSFLFSVSAFQYQQHDSDRLSSASFGKGTI